MVVRDAGARWPTLSKRECLRRGWTTNEGHCPARVRAEVSAHHHVGSGSVLRGRRRAGHFRKLSVRPR